AFQSESGLDPAVVLPGQTVGEFHLVQEGLVRPMRAQRSLIAAEQVPFDRIEQLARETKGQDEKQLRLFGGCGRIGVSLLRAQQKSTCETIKLIKPGATGTNLRYSFNRRT